MVDDYRINSAHGPAIKATDPSIVGLGTGFISFPDSLALTSSVSVRGFVKETRPELIPRRLTTIPTTLPRTYVVSLSYMDQMSFASRRLKSLQCWAAMWKALHNVSVVEPFVIDGSRLGVPVNENTDKALKFSTVFDIDEWNSEGQLDYPKVVSWDTFLRHASRKVITIQIVYPEDYHCPPNKYQKDTCGSAQLTENISRHLTFHNFTVVNWTCINFRLLGAQTEEEFNSLILNTIPELDHVGITIIFDEWRGPVQLEREVKCFIPIKGATHVCSPNHFGHISMLTARALVPSSSIEERAKAYISRYLHQASGYVAVVIRWEKVLNDNFYHPEKQHSTGAECSKQILAFVKSIHSKHHSLATFLTTDIGKYGSLDFNLYNSTRAVAANVTSYTEELLRTFYNNKSMSLEEYDRMFEDFSGTTNPAFISQLQKAIAANARCLLLVGSGAFHQNTVKMYENLHPSSSHNCLKIIKSC